MKRGHVVIFAKAPRRGEVKLRLAAGIGGGEATRFYRTALAQLLRRIGSDPRWRCWLAVTPDRAARRSDVALPCLPQGRGDLGMRMARALRRFAPRPVLIIGADIPELSSRHLAMAFRRLAAADLVFGPAADGGYWLVGARGHTLPYGMCRGVRWSSEHALADTLASLSRTSRVAFADRLSDVDDAASFAEWRRRVSRRRGAR